MWEEVEFKLYLLRRLKLPFSADLGPNNFIRTHPADLEDAFCGTTFDHRSRIGLFKTFSFQGNCCQLKETSRALRRNTAYFCGILIDEWMTDRNSFNCASIRLLEIIFEIAPCLEP